MHPSLTRAQRSHELDLNAVVVTETSVIISFRLAVAFNLIT